MMADSLKRPIKKMKLNRDSDEKMVFKSKKNRVKLSRKEEDNSSKMEMEETPPPKQIPEIPVYYYDPVLNRHFKLTQQQKNQQKIETIKKNRMESKNRNKSGNKPIIIKKKQEPSLENNLFQSVLSRKLRILPKTKLMEGIMSISKDSKDVLYPYLGYHCNLQYLESIQRSEHHLGVLMLDERNIKLCNGIERGYKWDLFAGIPIPERTNCIRWCPSKDKSKLDRLEGLKHLDQ
eukprot:TRINITY_DN7876_c0_g1_i1.p1 TRINITY_DN7876_c0_g1~~TRINITY_DN7876_c0_g1_i1.p1  ORF type:complete len:234 (-),score=63.04 TRINITY_DN7876_c0_g1_i1:699-1400(-)